MPRSRRFAFLEVALACAAACTHDYESIATSRGTTSSDTEDAGDTGGGPVSGASTSTTSAGEGGASASAGGGPGGASSAASTSGAGGSGPVCGNGLLEPGEACDDASAFCASCQFACAPGWAQSASTGSCFKVVPEPPDWSNAKSWADASALCPGQAPSPAYVARLAGPGVLDVLPQLAGCPQINAGGTGGCWIGARCPGATCPGGQKDVTLDWLGRASQPIPSPAWSNGNPSGDGRCIEHIPNEGINDDTCTKLEHYICEIALL